MFCFRVWGSVYFDTLCFLNINAKVKKKSKQNIHVANRSRPHANPVESYRNKLYRCGFQPYVQSGTIEPLNPEFGSFTIKFPFKELSLVLRHVSGRLSFFASAYVGWKMGCLGPKGRRKKSNTLTFWKKNKRPRIFNKCLNFS